MCLMELVDISLFQKGFDCSFVHGSHLRLACRESSTLHQYGLKVVGSEIICGFYQLLVSRRSVVMTLLVKVSE